MFVNTTGIVLREVEYKDNAKILTVLTGDLGKLTVAAYGAHNKKSKLASATDLLIYSHMTLTERRNRWTLTEAQVIEQFTGLRHDLCSLSLASYIAELTETVADEDSINPGLLPLCLNTLYALSEKIKTPQHIKPAFELRLSAIAGYEPMLMPAEQTGGYMHIQEGILLLKGKAFDAAEYILTCNPKKLFSYILDGKSLKELTVQVEAYLLGHLEKSFKTLDYYKKMLDL